VVGALTTSSDFDVAATQVEAWLCQCELMRKVLKQRPHLLDGGRVYFEFAIPRMGSRADAVLVVGAVVFVIEFKVGERGFPAHAVRQATDYALDLKHFHASSHGVWMLPVLVCTAAAQPGHVELRETPAGDGLLETVETHGDGLGEMVDRALTFADASGSRTVAVDAQAWETGAYQPTPTIVEAALAMYRGHGVAEITRSDAGGANLARTAEAVGEVVRQARERSEKAVCFVTGVPGAGKTLVGLNIATQQLDENSGGVFLSGNGPLVKVLQEAMARDAVSRAKRLGKTLRKGAARSEVKTFVQNVHHYRDECLKDPGPPSEHVALFDEAQRAWDLDQTAAFMAKKKNLPNFGQSEPEFLLSCVDRHQDWGVVVCLVGGGQEINKGEAGLAGWLEAVDRSFSGWHVYLSDRLTDPVYQGGGWLEEMSQRPRVHWQSGLHLSVSMRSFRAEHVSRFVQELLAGEAVAARETMQELDGRYPIRVTRDLDVAKSWVRRKARGSERFGLLASSQAQRLKPLAIDMRLQPNPVHWHLADRDDVRSSYCMEDAASEFDVQGLEVDWSVVVWDADLRRLEAGWSHHLFRGRAWQRRQKEHLQAYTTNAYRVLLTRARQGMVIVVPEGDSADATRSPAFYDGTYDYLRDAGVALLGD